MSLFITGGTGSFGKALVAYLGPGQVTVYSRDEEKQRQMALAFPWVRYVIGDVRDRERLLWASRDHAQIIHAAAQKQVPACEEAPGEAVRTNVLGAEHVADAAERHGARLVALSTDKAVEPVNAYGATKMLAERIILSRGHGLVRYGNVLGSRGSILPVFRAQVAAGEPLTITDPTMTRFVLTLEQAVALVIRALALSGAQIVVAKPPAATVEQIAAAVAPGHPTRIIGVRTGEKLHERLVSPAEHAVEQPDHFLITSGPPTGLDYTSDRAPIAENLSELIGAL